MQKTRLVVGGDIVKALQGDYHFDLKQTLQEGWELTRHNKWAIVQGILFVFTLWGLLFLTASDLLLYFGYDAQLPQLQGFIGLCLSVLMAPLMTGIIMMGINHSVGGLSKASHLFFFLPKSALLALSSLLASLLVELGLSLLFLPGLYLLIATSFTLPLVVEKGLSPTRAIFISIRVVTFKWWLFIALYLVFALLFLLVILSFGIAAIWVAPLYYNVKGILYRDIFGVAVKIEQKGETKGESAFFA